MKKALCVVFLVAGLAVAGTKSYSVKLFQPSVVAGTELQAGDYKVELQDNKVVIKSGKTVVTAPVKVENEASKYASTTVRYSNSEGKYHIEEIRLGGTHMRLVLNN